MLNWSMILGHDETGVTLHRVEETLDTGEIYAIRRFPIHPKDDINSLKIRMMDEIPGLLDETLPQIISGESIPSPQDHRKARYYPQRSDQDGRIDWQKNAMDVWNLVRALVHPYPGAFCFLGDQKLIIDKADVEIDNRTHRKPGRIVEMNADGQLKVTCGYNCLVIQQFRNGETIDRTKLGVGERFE